MDFFKVAIKNMTGKKVMIYPEYDCTSNFKDIMIKGQSFYAIWDEENNTWSQSQSTLVRLIDNELRKEYENYKERAINTDIFVKYLSLSSTKAIDDFNHWCKDQAKDNFRWLNSKIVFSNTETKREDYSSIRLNYALAEGDTSAWDELTDRLYSPEEKRKIEYAIGSLVSGASKKLQKFFIFVGDAGTGKSTIMGIIKDMFPGYCSGIDIEALGSSNSSFALEPLKENPLIAIQNDSELGKIDTNVRLNSIISPHRKEIERRNKK